MSEVNSYSSTSDMCMFFVAVELTDIAVAIHCSPYQENLRIVPVATTATHNSGSASNKNTPCGERTATIKNLPISKGSIELITAAGSLMLVIPPGATAESIGNGWIVSLITGFVELPCDCGSLKVYGSGGPHADWCSSNV